MPGTDCQENSIEDQRVPGEFSISSAGAGHYRPPGDYLDSPHAPKENCRIGASQARLAAISQPRPSIPSSLLICVEDLLSQFSFVASPGFHRARKCLNQLPGTDRQLADRRERTRTGEDVQADARWRGPAAGSRCAQRGHRWGSDRPNAWASQASGSGFIT
jgi:hypothetical protein